MIIIHSKIITDLCGPVSTPAEVTNKMEVAKLVMNTVKEAGLIPGAFDADELFSLERETIREAESVLVKKLAPPTDFTVYKPCFADPGEMVKLEQTRNHEYETGST
ncbi:hypothetical protein PHMEG_00013744 [Phytophthora megakarya]|uniref:Uncharacterized protein n=1 Tax=Phytophthora megakarya TaxID=4795 RepID=A0A225W5L2_9STRA|nr:hypothetical protein PHMEG_00013744 [Phytophthora megakarya]